MKITTVVTNCGKIFLKLIFRIAHALFNLTPEFTMTFPGKKP
jgi:hypothetical protein